MTTLLHCGTASMADAPSRMSTTITRPLRVGLLGAGMVSTHHLHAWRSLGGAALVLAIADFDPQRSAQQAQAFGIPASHSSLQAMLASHTLDAIDILTPPASHASDCMTAARHGLHILCQKPLAPTLDQAENLARQLNGPGRVMVHENWRFRPHYRQIHQWLVDKRIGPVRSGRLRVHSAGLLPDAHGRCPALVRQPLLARLPRMMVAEVLVHHLDLARWLLDAHAVVGSHLTRGAPCIAGESGARIELRLPSGGLLHVEGDMADPTGEPGLRDTLLLEGDAGRIVLAGDELALECRESTRLPVNWAGDYQASYDGAIGHFVHALRTGDAFETPITHHLDVLRTVEHIYALS